MSTDKPDKSLLNEARRNSVIYTERATEFSERVEAFARWLHKLDFRIESEGSFDFGDKCLLSFNKSSGNWALRVYFLVGDNEWKYHNFLNNCSIELKIAAVEAFPELLQSLITRQRDELAKVEEAHTTLDDMTRTIGSFEEEGE